MCVVISVFLSAGVRVRDSPVRYFVRAFMAVVLNVIAKLRPSGILAHICSSNAREKSLHYAFLEHVFRTTTHGLNACTPYSDLR